MTKEVIGSIKELLKLISYLAIDLGWSNDLADPSIYDDENLVDTFNSENIYKVNYFSYCKKNGDKRTYCVRNGNYGRDVIGILVRDVGIQLGKVSSLHTNDTQILGDSLVIAYHLALNSIRKFIRGDRSRGNAFFNTFLDVDSDSPGRRNNASHYSKGVEILYWLGVSNQILFFLQISEIAISFLCLLTVVGFGIVLAFAKRHRSLPILLKITSSLLVVTATVSLLCTVLYFLTLKTLEPSKEASKTPTGWELLELRIGKGFIIDCARYAIQIFLLPITVLAANHYSVRKLLKDNSDSKDSCSSKDDV